MFNNLNPGSDPKKIQNGMYKAIRYNKVEKILKPDPDSEEVARPQNQRN